MRSRPLASQSMRPDAANATPGPAAALWGQVSMAMDRIANDAHVIRQITRGGEDMPPFGSKLTPEEILAVSTYLLEIPGATHTVCSSRAKRRNSSRTRMVPAPPRRGVSPTLAYFVVTFPWIGSVQVIHLTG